jgi:hypothetical protein
MESAREERRFDEYGLSGSVVGMVAGALAVILAIIGLSGVHSLGMVAVSVIVVGLALLVESGIMGAEYSNLLAHVGKDNITRMEVGAGLGVEGVAGVVAVIFGVLALSGVNPGAMVAIGTLLLGVGVMFASRLHDRIRSMRIDPTVERDEMDRVTRELLGTATGAQVLVGLGAVILAILALVGFAPITLTLVAVLAIGASILIGGAMLGSHFWFLFRRS